MLADKPYPIQCSRCQAIDGWPTKARTSNQAIVVDFRCRVCGSEWNQTLPTVAARETVDQAFGDGKTPPD